MIYVVSGFMRTGTSMMMKALEAGGMDALYDNEERYELTHKAVAALSINPRRAEGKVFKCFTGGLVRFAAWKWKLLIMRRPYDEIQKSLLKYLGPEEGKIIKKKDFDGLMQYSIGQMSQRRDMQWVSIDYHAVLNDPLGVFRLLKEDGWPIDPGKSAAIIDPEKCHFRTETTTRTE